MHGLLEQRPAKRPPRCWRNSETTWGTLEGKRQTIRLNEKKAPQRSIRSGRIFPIVRSGRAYGGLFIRLRAQTGHNPLQHESCDWVVPSEGTIRRTSLQSGEAVLSVSDAAPHQSHQRELSGGSFKNTRPDHPDQPFYLNLLGHGSEL